MTEDTTEPGDRDALFVPDRDAFMPTEASLGPWGATLLHGGPVAALLSHQMVLDGDANPSTESSTPVDWQPVRFTAELMRPLPLAPLSVRTVAVRVGRKARIDRADLLAGDTVVARASLQRIRRADVAVDNDNPAKAWRSHPPSSAPDALPRAVTSSALTARAFHHSSVEHRGEHTLMGTAGPGRDWMRVTAQLFPGVELAPFERVVASADFGNGISASLDFGLYTFLNADLSVHVFRLPVDEWVLVDAITHVDDHGVGLAESALSDRLGLIGRACQSLVIDRR